MNKKGWKAIWEIINYIVVMLLCAMLAIVFSTSSIFAAEVPAQETIHRICTPEDRIPIAIDGKLYTLANEECKERNVWVKIKKVFLYIGKIGITIAAIFRGPAIVGAVTEMWEFKPYE